MKLLNHFDKEASTFIPKYGKWYEHKIVSLKTLFQKITSFKVLRERIESELKELTNEIEIQFSDFGKIRDYIEEDITEEFKSKCLESNIYFEDNKFMTLKINPNIDVIKKEIFNFKELKSKLNIPFLSFLHEKY